MKRHVIGAMLLAVAAPWAAFSQEPSPPASYVPGVGAYSYDHGGSPVRPVYHQPRLGSDSAFQGEQQMPSVYDQPLTMPKPNGYRMTAIDDLIDPQTGGCVECGGCSECGDCPSVAGDCVRSWDMWVKGEYLLWWTEGSRLPALVTTATGTGSGILGDADTMVLIGDSRVDNQDRSGGRFTFGAWLHDDHSTAIEGNFFVLENSSTELAAASDGSTIVARPFFNVELQTPAVQMLAAAGVSSGGVFVTTESKANGAELLLRRRLDNCCERRIDMLYGYRYAGLDEQLLIQDMLTSTDPLSNVPVGTVVGGFDSFQTFNQFHGGEIGMAVDFYRPGWTLGLVGKVALGNMREQVTIGGTTFVAVPNQSTVESAGGLLTQPSNIGGFFRDEFAVIPEAQLNVRFFLTKNLEVTVGYTFIYYNEVVRPADQIDFRIDPRQITDPTNASPLPAFDFVSSDFWLQGLNVGLEYKF